MSPTWDVYAVTLTPIWRNANLAKAPATQREIVIPDEPTAAKCPLYLLRLRRGGVDAEFIAVFHLDTSNILLVLYVLLDDRQRRSANGRNKI